MLQSSFLFLLDTPTDFPFLVLGMLETTIKKKKTRKKTNLRSILHKGTFPQSRLQLAQPCLVFREQSLVHFAHQHVAKKDAGFFPSTCFSLCCCNHYSERVEGLPSPLTALDCFGEDKTKQKTNGISNNGSALPAQQGFLFCIV